MTKEKKRLVVGISGASGSNLAVILLAAMRELPDWETHLVYSDGARRTILHETPFTCEQVESLATQTHDLANVGASIASGTFRTEGMVIIPCSMKTLAGVAVGYSANLMLRAADVVLKERRKLVLVTRETPLHMGHMQNMMRAAELGAVILPPMLTHYILPKTVEDMERHIVGKVMSEFGIEFTDFQRWTGIE